MMRIYDWAKGKTSGFRPKDVSRVFGMTCKQAGAELRELVYAGTIKRRKKGRQYVYFAVLPPEEQLFVELPPRFELFPLIRLPEATAKALTQAST